MNVTRAGFLEIDITPEMRQESLTRDQQFFAKYGDSGTHRLDKKGQRKTGYIAEAGIRLVFPSFAYYDGSEVDFVCGGVTLDSKAQGCNSEPRPHFVGTLYKGQETRKFDFLIFCRVRNDDKKVWVCGFIKKDDYLKKAKLCEAGTENNNFRYDQARYELEYQEMTSAKRVLETNGTIIGLSFPKFEQPLARAA